MALTTMARPGSTGHRRAPRRLHRLAGALVLLLLAGCVLGGCGSSTSQASFLSQDSSSAGLLQWTQTGHTLSGSLALAEQASGSLTTRNLAFTGTLSGAYVTLTFPEGFGTTTTNVVGTISGLHLRLSLPAGDGTLTEADFYPGTVAQYNQAVDTLVDDQRGQTPSHVGDYATNWPTNPYTKAPMVSGTGPGDYSYTTTGKSYQLVGYGADGQAVITVPQEESIEARKLS
jgi:hypothetical protein